jgi:nitroreductase
MTAEAIAPERPAALQARYGERAVPETGPWNQTIETILAHRSVRAYRSTPVPAGTLETLVAAAQSAPTSSNLQTWSVVSVTDPATRATLAEVANNQLHIVQCPLFLVWLADLSRTERMGKERSVTLEGLPYLETFLVAAIDAALAAQNAVVAAESLGLSTVYIGALRNDPQRVAAELNLPEGAAAMFGLCIGYADPARPAEVKPRLPQSVVLHRGRYDFSQEAPVRTSYDRTMAAFSERNEMARSSWTDRVFSRLTTIANLNGRDRLRTALGVLGFPLR